MITVICGPTAVGKTAQALDFAEKIGAEIISADSGQIYRGMDIGTAKPTKEDQSRISIHLIDILNPNEQYSAQAFREQALQKISEIQFREKKVLIVGGTGLYIKALEKGLFEGPKRDENVRKKLEEEWVQKGSEFLHERLKSVDPEAADSIPHQNRQRLIRALEVYELTGKPISSFWKEHSLEKEKLPLKKIGLILPREELYERVNHRVDQMFEQGLVNEVKQLLERWGEDAPGLKIIGYKEIVSFLKKEISLNEATELIKKNTRHYVKRQLTWFKADPEIEWVSSLK